MNAASVDQYLELVAHVVITLVTLFVLIGGRRVIAHLVEVLGLKLEDADRLRLEAALVQAVSFAEEQAHRAVKRGGAMSSEQKLETAITRVKDAGFDLKAEDIEPLIASQLGALRLRGRTTTTNEE